MEECLVLSHYIEYQVTATECLTQYVLHSYVRHASVHKSLVHHQEFTECFDV